ncbi:V-set domain-containing T-cell activation inhibitor 1-like isoform X1 [Anabas testudineus]|uniref:V-set domain-containing T-cell activation inhibitor 1-like isoform X1 n=1 Tax=Anabas testudineus TaxID=64144 RepID=UPI00143DA6E0|nr:V-set domain-containing T-cell activation inhibitor 1-like isoform X1 [Anabas testudineus]
MKGASLLCLLFLTSVLRCSKNQEVIKANPEDNVILQCKGSGNNAKLMLKWIRPDLRSEGYVYFFREDHSYEQYQHPMFRGRVELRDPEMKDGDFSVILKRVGVNDTGSYKCFIVNNSTAGTTEPISIIHLKVEADQKNITAETGDAVTLPCQVPRDTQILVLEWIRPDLEPENVFFYKNGQSHPERQHPSFRNRVELKDEHMEEGDLSLILKNVMISDTGTYECHVYQSERNHTMSIIDLKVDDSGDAAGHKGGGNTTLIVVVVLVLFLVVGIVGFWFYKKQRGSTDQSSYQQPPEQRTELQTVQTDSAAESSSPG